MVKQGARSDRQDARLVLGGAQSGISKLPDRSDKVPDRSNKVPDLSREEPAGSNYKPNLTIWSSNGMKTFVRGLIVQEWCPNSKKKNLIIVGWRP